MKGSLNTIVRALRVVPVLVFSLGSISTIEAAFEVSRVTFAAGGNSVGAGAITARVTVAPGAVAGAVTSPSGDIKVTAGFWGGFSTGAAPGDSILRVCPDNATAVAGAQVTVPILITGNASVMPDTLDAFGFNVVFDKTYLAFDTLLTSGFTAMFDTLGGELVSTGDTIRVGALDTTPTTGPAAPRDTLGLVVFNVDSAATGSAFVTTTKFTDDLAGLANCTGTIVFTPLATVNDGDVNGDGAITPGDALCACLAFMNGGTMTPECLFGTGTEDLDADVNCDGVIMMSDGMWIFERSLCGGAPLACGGTGPACPPVPFAGESQFLREASAVTELRIADVTLGSADPVDLPVAVRGSGALRAVGLDLTIPSGWELVGFERSEATREWYLFDHAAREDGVRIGGIDATGFELDESRWMDLGTLRLRPAGATIESGRVTATWLESGLLEPQILGGNLRSASSLPTEFALGAARPNPFRSEVAIEYAIPAGEARSVEIQVFNVAGRVVKTLESALRAPGTYTVTWGGEDSAGERVAAGIYFYRLKTDSFEKTRKLVYTR